MNENSNEVRGGIQISLIKLLQCYLRKLWLIILCTVVAGVGTYLYTTRMITPVYAAKATIIVSNIKAANQLEYVTGSNISTSKMLVNTYMSVIRSDRVLSSVIEQSGIGNSPAYIRGHLYLAQENDTEIFSVTVRHTDAQYATDLANAVAKYAPDVIASIVDGSSAQTLDFATVPGIPYSPNVRNNTSIGCFVGLLLSVVFITLLYLLDGRLKDAETLEQMFDLPVLGEIPDFKNQDGKKRNAGYGESAAKKEDKSK